MDVIQIIRRKLRGRSRAEVKAFADRCGVNYYTFRKVISGETVNPGYRLVDKVRPHIHSLERRTRRAA